MSYQQKKIGDCLIKFDRGISWSRKDETGDTGTPVLRIPNIHEGEIDHQKLKYINTNKKGGVLQRDDIVMVASNGNPDLVGRSTLVTEKEAGMLFASFLVRLQLDSTNVLPHYASYFLRTPIFKKELRRKIATTSGIYNLRKEHIEEIQIPVAPLEIQNKIVNYLKKIAEGQAINNDLITKTSELLESLVNRNLNASSKKLKLGSLFERVSETILPLQHSEVSFNYIGLENITSNTGQLINFHPTIGKLIRSNKTVFKKGDILYGKLRPYLNKVWFAEFDGICSTDIWVLRAENKIIVAKLLCLLLRTPFIVGKATSFMKGANLPRADKGLFDDIRVSIPAYEEQQKLAVKFSSVLEYMAGLIQQQAAFQELFNSVLLRSFTREFAEAKEEVKVSKFALQQAIAAVLRQFERGEMVLAKVLYIAQEIYQVPLGFRFAAHNFGPYDAEIKRALMAGMSTYNRFFMRKGTGVYALGANAEKLFKYRSKVLGSMTAVLNDLLPYIKNADSSSIECLATVCKIMQDNKTTDLEVIKQKMYEWKKDRFSAVQIKGAYEFSISKEWDKKLTI